VPAGTTAASAAPITPAETAAVTPAHFVALRLPRACPAFPEIDTDAP
jgi:hypothetical protein